MCTKTVIDKQFLHEVSTGCDFPANFEPRNNDRYHYTLSWSIEKRKLVRIEEVLEKIWMMVKRSKYHGGEATEMYLLNVLLLKNHIKQS